MSCVILQHMEGIKKRAERKINHIDIKKIQLLPQFCQSCYTDQLARGTYGNLLTIYPSYLLLARLYSARMRAMPRANSCNNPGKTEEVFIFQHLLRMFAIII